MTEMTDKTSAPSRLQRLLMRIWGALPILLMLGVTIVLGQMIAAKSERLDALKQGLFSLEAKRLAMEKRVEVVDIIGKSANQAEAVKKLAEKYAIDTDQAKLIVHMPLSAMTGEEQARVDRQIAYIREQIAARKLDIEPERPEVNVVAMPLSPEVIRDRINLPGIVEPWVKYNIIAEVRGEVTDKRIEKGAPVKAGDVIAVLDQRDYVIALDAAEASFETALASKKRLQKLYAEQLASRSQLDDITAQVERFEAEMQAARLNLERCTITSPITGIVNNVYIEDGQYAGTGDGIAEVMQMDRVKVSVGIPESDVSDVAKVGMFDVKFDALGGKVFQAKKHFLSLSSDPAARLYALELAIDNPEREILPDMFARVDILKRQIPDALIVPLYSVITLSGEQVVYVVNDDTAHARPVETGIQEGWRIQITKGLNPGDRLIVVGHRRVSEGQRVNVIRTVSDMEELK